MALPVLMAGAGLAYQIYSDSKRKGTQGIDQGAIDRRRSEIDKFETNLNQARSRYLQSLGNMYNTSYARFASNAEAGFANRGLAVNGGAFASTLARETASNQANLEPLAYNAEREDIGTVDSARANLFSGSFNASNSFAMQERDISAANARSIGGYAMNAVNQWYSAKDPMKQAANDASTGSYNNYGGGPGNYNPFDGSRTGTSRGGKVYWDKLGTGGN